MEVDDSLAIFRRAMLTDPGFFEVFKPNILSGETAEPLKDPNAVYLTEQTAEAFSEKMILWEKLLKYLFWKMDSLLVFLKILLLTLTCVMVLF
ncbi:MAG TPA: hypothetical protein ENL20_13000 [Candidatus Cloacimonetes bacterium]|nr:hypothetical protein [Candidatus Cloacimonadota bacterium]